MKSLFKKALAKTFSKSENRKSLRQRPAQNRKSGFQKKKFSQIHSRAGLSSNQHPSTRIRQLHNPNTPQTQKGAGKRRWNITAAIQKRHSRLQENNQGALALVGSKAEVECSSLQIRDFIKPDQKLKTALEGFFLNQRSERTRLAYSKDLKRFVNYIRLRSYRSQEAGGEGQGEDLKRNVFLGYKEHLSSEKLSPITIDRHLATLKSLMRWLVEEAIIDKSPMDSVRFLNPSRVSKTKGFEDEEVRRLLSLPEIHRRSGAQHYAMLMLLFYCGLRRSELLQLRTSQIVKERGVPILRLLGKGDKERIVRVPDAVFKAIRHHCKMNQKFLSIDALLFTPLKNNVSCVYDKPIDGASLYYMVRRYARLAGIQTKVSPHSCRATAISNARDKHAGDRVIQEFAGWSSPQMIVNYDKRKTAIENSASMIIQYGDKDRVFEQESKS